VTASIAVTRAGDAFDVRVSEGGSETRHRVTLSQEDHARLAPGVAPDALIAAAFRFLLDREPKESILARFDVSVISRYFPEFGEKLPSYLR
jgi:hypothetical protein